MVCRLALNTHRPGDTYGEDSGVSPFDSTLNAVGDANEAHEGARPGSDFFLERANAIETCEPAESTLGISAVQEI